MARDQIHHDQTGRMTGPLEQDTAAGACCFMTGEVGVAEPASGNKAEAPTARAQQRASHLAAKAGESVRQAGEHARDAAQDAVRRIRQQGTSAAAAQKDRAAEELSHFGRAIHRAADTLRDDGDHNIAEYADFAAGKIDEATRYLRERDLGRLVGDAEMAARRRPEVVYGAMFIAGLALSRFIKASTRNRPRFPQQDELMARVY